MLLTFKSYVKVNGKSVFINSDTVTCIKVIGLLSKKTPKSLGEALALFYKEWTEQVNEESVSAMSDFLFKDLDEFPSKDNHKKVLDLEKDFDAIWSSIYRVYHVDIVEDKPHWWKFLLMLADLSKEPLLVNRISIRSTKLSDVKNQEARSHIRKEQERVALEKKLSLEERNKKWAGG